MKQLIILVTLSVIITILVVKVHNDRLEQIPRCNTTSVKFETYTKDSEKVDYLIKYQGEDLYYVGSAINMFLKQETFKKGIFDILKQDGYAKAIKDSLTKRIKPIDSTFDVIILHLDYTLSPEIDSLWMDYINSKIEANKALEMAEYVKILCGE